MMVTMTPEPDIVEIEVDFLSLTDAEQKAIIEAALRLVVPSPPR